MLFANLVFMMTIKNCGARVVNAWEDLRPMTKKLLANALNSRRENPSVISRRKFSYDKQTEWEISGLLTVLDEQIGNPKIRKNAEKLGEIKDLAKTCEQVLEAKIESAEVFIQLAERALFRNDFDKIDELADILLERFPASEIAEIIRQTEMAQIRAIGFETLVLLSVSAILPLFEDPLYNEIAQIVIEQKAYEFDDEEAQMFLGEYDFNSDF